MITGTQLLKTIRERRRAVAQQIIAHPENFCVCEGCSSILALPIKGICHYCHSYRFDYSADGVIAMAQICGRKPIATACALLPRYAAQINQT